VHCSADVLSEPVLHEHVSSSRVQLSIVLFLCSGLIASRNAGPTFVTHDCTQLSMAVAVSSLLNPLSSDCRPHFAGSSIYRPSRRRSPAAVVVALLLLGGVEPNPGPSSAATMSFSLLNARSAHHKAALNHDVIDDHRPERGGHCGRRRTLDVLALTETWIPSDAPDAVKLDVTPPGYSVIHCHHCSSTG